MAKNYDISKKSDMDRFMKDLNKTIMDNARDQVTNLRYNVKCPHCGGTVSQLPGFHPCALCREMIDLKLDINF